MGRWVTNVSPKSAIPAPVHDRHYWRRLLARAHPDSGGEHSLFLWALGVREYVAGETMEPPRPEYAPPRRSTRADSRRVPFDESRSFDYITARALRKAVELEEPFRTLIGLLEGAVEVGEEAGPLYRMQRQGATFKSLAALGHKANMNGAQRARLYRIAEELSLSQGHAGHLHKKLAEQEDAA
jgi:hypothetical protein